MSRSERAPWSLAPGALLRQWALPCVVGALVAALALTALRVDLLRARYGLAEAVREEQALRLEESELTVELRRLRDPARLAELAREQGFVRPDRVIEVAAPAADPGREPADRNASAPAQISASVSSPGAARP